MISINNIIGKFYGLRSAVVARSLRPVEAYEPGSAQWLQAAEVRFGGRVRFVSRNIVSPYDPAAYDADLQGGDRMIHHRYARHYATHLGRFVEKRDDPWVIVEVGILRGTGLAIWSSLFPNAEVIGLDIDTSHCRGNLDYLRACGAFLNGDPTLIEFDQFKPDTAELEERLAGRTIDIVIDDGYHSAETIDNTMTALRPLLSRTGVYFVEDNSTIGERLEDTVTWAGVHCYDELTVLEWNLNVRQKLRYR